MRLENFVYICAQIRESALNYAEEFSDSRVSRQGKDH